MSLSCPGNQFWYLLRFKFNLLYEIEAFPIPIGSKFPVKTNSGFIKRKISNFRYARCIKKYEPNNCFFIISVCIIDCESLWIVEFHSVKNYNQYFFIFTIVINTKTRFINWFIVELISRCEPAFRRRKSTVIWILFFSRDSMLPSKIGSRFNKSLGKAKEHAKFLHEKTSVQHGNTLEKM